MKQRGRYAKFFELVEKEIEDRKIHAYIPM